MAGKRILNVDEANLPQAAFVRRGWGVAGKSLRQLPKPLGHRLTVIAGVDTCGKTYFTLSQRSNDGRVFGGFLHRLAGQLDGEDPDWRDNTVLVLDGAAYHRGAEASNALAALRIPTMIAGPYGYDAAPAEKLFALLKAGDLNPASIKTGKR